MRAVETIVFSYLSAVLVTFNVKSLLGLIECQSNYRGPLVCPKKHMYLCRLITQKLGYDPRKKVWRAMSL